jgi:hypothetical protein
VNDDRRSEESKGDREYEAILICALAFAILGLFFDMTTSCYVNTRDVKKRIGDGPI